MRCAAVLAAAGAMLLAGCGGDSSAVPVWEGPPRPLPADGTLPVEEFDAYLEATEHPWESSAVGVATSYALPLAGDAGSLQAVSGPEGTSPVTVAIRGLLDDSVAELRLTLLLDRDGPRWRLAEAAWAQRCRPSRGHRTYSPEPCT
jgi:hypothetical protein